MSFKTTTTLTQPDGTMSVVTTETVPDPAALPVIDCHQHMWYPGKHWNCPWLSDPACASINREFSMEDYMQTTSGNNVVKTVFLETDAAKEDFEKESGFVGTLCADASKPVVGAVVGADLTCVDFKSYIDRAKLQGFIKGIRDVMHAKPKGFCLQPEVLENIQYAGGAGLSVDICIQPDQLLDCASMCSQCPSVTFIIDHCGGHQGLKGTCPDAGPADAEQKAAWEAGIAALAKLPNVIIKISGLYGGWQGGWAGWTFECQTATVSVESTALASSKVIDLACSPCC